MKTEDIERLNLEELTRMANDPDANVPETHSAKLHDIACAVSLMGNGLEALDPQSTPIKPHISPWLWGVIPAAALAAVACILLLRQPQRPKDTFSDPTLAYVETMRAFSLLNDVIQEITIPVESAQENN